MAKEFKKKALGRGLSALLKDPENDIKTVFDKGAEKLVGSIIELDITSITENPFQPRSNFNEETLQELASSIKELGVIQPITVRKTEYNKFQLVSGERRFRASKYLGLKTIPAYIRIANDQEVLEMALVENIQRQDLDPIEIALSYHRLIEEIKLTQEQMSNRVGKKRSTITNYLRLLKLDPIIQTGMRDNFVSMGHGRALINVEDRKSQIKIYEKIIQDGLSVRDTENLVRKYKEKQNSPKSSPKAPLVPEFVSETREDFKNYFSSNVDVKISTNGRGRLIIPFASEEDFKRIKKLIFGA